MKKKKFYCRSGFEFKLDRRTALQGVFKATGISVSLPLLDAMLGSSGMALAQGGDANPVRFGTFYWGNGSTNSTRGSWIPQENGTITNLPAILSPLENQQIVSSSLLPYLTFFSGLNHRPSQPAHAPWRGISLSGSHSVRFEARSAGPGYRGEPPLPSIDTLVQKEIQGSAPLEWIGISIAQSGPYTNQSSWEVNGASKPFYSSPSQLFDKLFVQNSAGMGAGANAGNFDEIKAMRLSILDTILQPSMQLSAKLGKEDQARLEQHLDGIRKIEKQISELDASQLATCSSPSAPSDNIPGDGRIERSKSRTRIMAQLLATAMQCDIVRTFCFEFSACQTMENYGSLSRNLPMHSSTHGSEDGQAYTQQAKNAYVSFVMENLAILGEELQSKTQIDSNLLDNTLILATSEHSGIHSNTNHPYLMLGKAAGKVKGGFHYNHTSGDANAVRALLTAAHAVGVELPVVGMESRKSTGDRIIDTSDFRATQVISEIFT